MKLSPSDVAKKSFSKKMMGFDQDEVLDYLAKIAQHLETLMHERNALKETLREKDLALMEYKERDQILKNAITTATQMSEKLRSDAERESKLILNDAQQKAEIITRDAKDSLKGLYHEVSELKRARLQFEANLKALAQAHLSLLEQGERYMPKLKLENLDFEV